MAEQSVPSGIAAAAWYDNNVVVQALVANAYERGVAAGRAQAAEAERERDEAHKALNATRQMSIAANAALRTQLLAALGVQDDGRTPLGDYVAALVADRDAAEARGRAQAAADLPRETEEIIGWLYTHGLAVDAAPGAVLAVARRDVAGICSAAHPKGVRLAGEAS